MQAVRETRLERIGNPRVQEIKEINRIIIKTVEYDRLK